jgi:hypothetical protein
VNAQGLFHFCIAMWFRRSFTQVVFLGALVTGCAETTSRPSELLEGHGPISSLSPAEIRCFDKEFNVPGETRPLVVALLSPRMVYSLLEWPRMQGEADSMGFRVQAWRDPRIPDEEWQAAQASKPFSGWGAPWPLRLPADCLAPWGPIDHLPLTRVVLHTHLHKWPIWGVMTSTAWRESLQNRLQVLQAAAKAKSSNRP